MKHRYFITVKNLGNGANFSFYSGYFTLNEAAKRFLEFKQTLEALQPGFTAEIHNGDLDEPVEVKA